MSIIETQVVDGIATTDDGKELIMLITDHLNWDNEMEHLLLLQDKINTYIEFWEDKQYVTIYQDKSINKAVIEIHFLHGVSKNCMNFIKTVNKQLSMTNISIEVGK